MGYCSWIDQAVGFQAQGQSPMAAAQEAMEGVRPSEGSLLSEFQGWWLPWLY